MSNVCPKGHFSTDPDYCSECGSPLQAAPASAPSAPRNSSAATALRGSTQSVMVASVGSTNCPDCMTPRPEQARFCEVCRFDFVARKSFSGLASSDVAGPTSPPPAPSVVSPVAEPASAPVMPMASATTPSTPAPASGPTTAAIASSGAPRLLLRIVVDPSLNKDPDPQSPCPTNAPERVFHLDLDENTLGRQFEGHGVHPEIVVQDPSISRRHLKFIRDAASRFSVLELGSANGTEINAKVLEPGVVTPLQPGDQLTLGMWTRVHVQAR